MTLARRRDYFYRKYWTFLEEVTSNPAAARLTEPQYDSAREVHDDPPFTKRTTTCQSKHPYFAPNANAA